MQSEAVQRQTEQIIGTLHGELGQCTTSCMGRLPRSLQTLQQASVIQVRQSWERRTGRSWEQLLRKQALIFKR